ncbi:MAG: anti-sigma factor antagonist [Firmicutes bacterium]|nr:anti-sigma factor antagonist [Bacillota bacterium]
MRTETRAIGNVLVVRLSGELDLGTAPEFRGRVEEELDARPDVTCMFLVLRDVTFIDSSGLGVILGRYKRLRARGGSLVAVSPSPQVRKVFELSGLATIIPVCETEDEAWARASGV